MIDFLKYLSIATGILILVSLALGMITVIELLQATIIFTLAAIGFAICLYPITPRGDS